MVKSSDKVTVLRRRNSVNHKWTLTSARLLGIALVTAIFVSHFAPQAMFFPVRHRFGDVTVWAEEPPSKQIGQILRDAHTRVSKSHLYRGPSPSEVFLTNGGWRWHLIALRSSSAFGISMPFTEAIVINRTDSTGTMVLSGGTDTRRRPLAAVLAHEMTHGLIRARYGVLADFKYPAWLREGYCDYVSGGSTLSDAQADALRAKGIGSPALMYHDGRKQVERTLAKNNGSVAKLFTGPYPALREPRD